MSDQTRLDELLDRWEECRARGEEPSPEDLCPGDPGLAGELLRRIAALGRIDAILRDGAAATTAWGAGGGEAGGPPAPSLQPAVSPYSALRFHARGGLGEVYRARDERLGRDVAIKLIQRSRAGSAEGRMRFEREAEVTGRLEHPGVAPVHAAGRCDDGRPYYVMRFIDGETLGDAIGRYHGPGQPARGPGERAIAFRDLLGRFAQVCKTIEYAHGRGVLHRDLKPANVMLGPYGETLVVDWGLAKPFEDHEAGPDRSAEEASGSPHLTAPGSALGTPAFMAPEQLGDALGGLGPETDVYGLGATLYALLTGRTPFEGGDLASVQARVRRGDFPRPREVRRDVPRALEAVCLKAMSLRPEVRYASPRMLADEVERWLADEPVTAYREPAAARLGRWARRHRQAAVSAGLALAVVAATATAAALVVNAALVAEKGAKAEAHASFRKAQRTVDDFLTAVSESKELQLLPDTQAFRRTLLEKARDYYRDFLGSRSGDSAVQFESGLATWRLANVVQDIGSKEEAVQLYERAVRLLEPLAHDPTKAGAQARLALVLNNLGELQVNTGRGAEGERSLVQGIDLCQALVRDHPEVASYQALLATSLYNLGGLQVSTGRGAEGERSLVQGIDLCQALVRDHPEVASYQTLLATGLTNLGNLLHATGRKPEAKQSHARSVGVFEKLVRDNPKMALYQDYLAGALLNLGFLQNDTGHRPEAERSYTRTVAIRESLVRDNPKVTEYQAGLALALNNLGDLQNNSGRIPESERSYVRAIELYESLVRDNPKVAAYQAGLALALNNLGILQRATGRIPNAERSYAQAIAVRESLVRDHPKVTDYQAGLAQTLNNLGNVQRDTGRTPEAERSYTRAVAIRESLARDHPKVTDYQYRLALALISLGNVQRDTGRTPEAERSYTRAVAICESLARDDPKVAPYQDRLAMALNNLGVLQRDTGRGAEAEQSHRRAIAIREALIATNPDNPDYLSGLAGTLGNLAEVRALASKNVEAVDVFRRAIVFQQQARTSNPRNPRYRQFLSEHLHGLSNVLRRLRRPSEAAEASRERAKLWPGVAGQQYDIACEFALCMPLADGAEATRLGDEAMGALKSAVAAGWSDANHTARDPDLIPLRGRADFQCLLQSLQDRSFPADPFGGK